MRPWESPCYYDRLLKEGDCRDLDMNVKISQ